MKKMGKEKRVGEKEGGGKRKAEVGRVGGRKKETKQTNKNIHLVSHKRNFEEN